MHIPILSEYSIAIFGDILLATIQNNMLRRQPKDALANAVSFQLKIQEMAFNERQRAIEKNEKMLEKRKAQKPLVKYNKKIPLQKRICFQVKVNKFMERIILTEEIEKVRPERPISSNAVSYNE